MDRSVEQLKELERVEILALMDNYVDVLLEGTDVVTRPALAEGEEIPKESFLAEHGTSLLVTAYEGGEPHRALFDVGHGKKGLSHNMEKLGVTADSIETIVLSHFHMDHTGGLKTLLNEMRRPVPIVVHPDAFLFPRYREEKDGTRKRFPRMLVREELNRKNVEIIESREPALILQDRILVTGEVERTTEFETGMPGARIERDGKIEQDPIRDDQALVIKLKGKGLVIVSGCSHSGIINTVHHARKITGEERVYAILGGFHLTGPYFEPIIDRTVEEMKKIAPEVIVPMHCTGWTAINRFSEAFPSAFILNSVGSNYTLA